MHRKSKKDHFIKKPIYKGGLKAMRQFLSKALKYPNLAVKHKIEGTVLVRYEVDHKGNVSGSKVLSSVGYGCDEEAMRIVSLLKFEIPKNPRKMRVKFQKTIRINFKIPKKVVAPPAKTPTVKTQSPKKQITYTITPKKTAAKPNPSKSYSYNIKY